MYNNYRTNSCPCCGDSQENYQAMYNAYAGYQCPYFYEQDFYREFEEENFENEFDFDRAINLKDYGPQPYVVNINAATRQNNTYRTALWTGKHLQLTLMSIRPGDDIGLEMHPAVDQFLRIEQGQGIVKMGKNKERLDFQARVADDFAIFVPAGTWHNVINTGRTPLKLYSIYAPPNHPHGVVQVTKPAAHEEEGHRKR